MSDTAILPAPIATPSTVNRVSEWGTVIVSALVILVYLAAIVVAYLMKNETMVNNLLMIAGTNATTAVGFWLGSSYGSAKKTDLLNAAPQKPNPTP